MISFHFSGVRVGSLADCYLGLLVDVVAHFEVRIQGQTWFSDDDFCLIEFAEVLLTWLRTCESSCGDMEYASVESDEDYLIRFRHLGSGVLMPESPWCRMFIRSRISVVELRRAATVFLNDLRQDLGDLLSGVRSASFLPEHRLLLHWLRGCADS